MKSNVAGWPWLSLPSIRKKNAFSTFCFSACFLTGSSGLDRRWRHDKSRNWRSRYWRGLRIVQARVPDRDVDEGRHPKKDKKPPPRDPRPPLPFFRLLPIFDERRRRSKSIGHEKTLSYKIPVCLLVAQRFQERPLTRLQDTNMTVFGQNLTETLWHLKTVTEISTRPLTVLTVLNISMPGVMRA